MFRFTIRDLMWLTVVVATASCFWNDHSKLNAARIELDAVRVHALLLRGELLLAKHSTAKPPGSVNWEFVDKPIP